MAAFTLRPHAMPFSARVLHTAKVKPPTRVWKGILGTQDVTKIGCGNRENDEYLEGIWDLTAPREAGLGIYRLC